MTRKKPNEPKKPMGGARPGAGRKPVISPSIKADLRSEAQKYRVLALATLANIARNVKSPPAARVAAASNLLDRGYGKPVQYVDAHVETVGNVGVYKVTRDKAFELQLAEKGVTLTPDDEDYDTSEAVEEAF